MGRRGPRPKPTALRKIEGVPGHRPLARHEPTPPRVETAPPAPRTLDLSGRAEWRRLAAQLQVLGLLTHLDLSALEVYCALFAEERQLRKLRARWVREKRDDVWRVDTAIDRKRGLQRQYLAEFGLSPSSRTRLETEAPPPAPVPLPTGTDGRDPRRFFRD